MKLEHHNIVKIIKRHCIFCEGEGCCFCEHTGFIDTTQVNVFKKVEIEDIVMDDNKNRILKPII